MDATSDLGPRVDEGVIRTHAEPVEETLRLSLSQREVWLDQRAWPDSPHLNIGGAAYLEGPMDLDLLRRALVGMVAENEALRLAPMSTGRQVLLPTFDREMEVVDLSASPDPRKAMRLWWETRIRDPFVLDGTPPWRFTLLRGSDELYGLSIQFHHLIMDGWGTTLVIRRWAEIYNELQRDGAMAQCEAPGYRKYIAESHAYRDSKAYEDDALYWRTQVPEVPPPLIERRYANGNGGAAGTGQLPLSRLVEQRILRADYDRLEAQAGESGLTPFNYVLAALALYFARVNNVQEVVVGVPSLNRSGRTYKATMGMFAGVLAVKVPVHPEMRIDELLAATRIAMRGALRHPRYPLSDLGRELEVIRQGRDGLLDIFLSFERQDYSVNFGSTPFLGARQAFSGSARYPLGVTVCEFHKENDLELILDASEACFSEGETELLGRRLWHLVESMRARPDAGVAELSIVPNEEQWAVLYGLHRDIATHEYPPPFITLFEHQVALRPEATAVVWDEGSIDYGTLSRRANLLAQRLRVLGAGRGAVVAMAMSRTAAMLVAMLAIAKTGAGFLPLDPDAPLERLSDILEQSEACALLIDPSSGGRLGQLHANIVRVRWNDPLADVVDPTVAMNPVQVAPRDLAYVLFTSGSTGRPKGVMVEHAVLSRRLAWLSRAYGVDWRDCSGQSTQYTFDPSLIELLLPLINGGRVALPPPGRLLPESLAEFSVRHGVTFIAFVPTTLSRFLDAATGLAGLKLRVACCGGEVLPPALARRFVTETGARLFNVYGPTEASIFATAWQCLGTAPGEGVDDSALPIGRPIDDTRIYVLDARLRPMPLGIAGEIYIAGDTLARGYLNRPDLDAAVFLDDPFQPGGRMYRTGDRGWLGVEGNLHFVGRLDRQVKLRGYRIELGEIEAACLQVHGVNQAAARLVESAGKPQIHAWVGAADHVTAQRLQSVLRQRLPDYMIPSAICVLPMLAESMVGKIDYDALPLQQPGALAEPARPPGTALERELVAIWEAALPARAIGIHDNFFDIGGDSLAAVSILTAIDAQLGCKVPMYTLTEHPTIERLAVALGKKITPPDMILSLSAENGRTPLYLAASGHGDLMRFTQLAKLVSDTFDVYMLQPPLDSPVKSLQSLAELYVNCIVAQGREPGVMAGFSVGGVAALETARLLKSSGAPVRSLVLLDTIHPRSIVGGVASWRLLGWLVRTLRVQELSMNGRRLGALVNDPGLVSQVMALRGFHPSAFDGHTCLVRSSGLANWDRLFFGKWRRLMRGRLTERRVPGLHGSIFEAHNVNELALALASVMEDRHGAG